MIKTFNRWVWKCQNQTQDLEIVERDENFVIESDANVDKLYSSESESLPKKKPNTTKIIPKKSNVLSSSSSSSHSLLKPNIESTKPKIKTLQLQSESESSEPAPVRKDDDVSGPEMDVADDFWN